MDSDIWAARLAATKRQYAFQSHNHGSRSDRLGIEGLELEDDLLPDFPCPYCYEDFDIASLCSHLEDEHSGESKTTVCPICSVKVLHDMLSHITHQHGHLLKMQRRHRLRRVAIPNSQAFLLLGRELREAHLQVLLGGGGSLRSNNSSGPLTATTDPFLSSLIMNFHAFEAEEIPKSVNSSIGDLSAKKTVPSYPWKKSNYDPSLSYEERERRMKQATERAGFVQDLLLATLLGD
ncbi:protein DEHYDRATION-INDUCED 19-like isoform X1 [Punica granatum]|uniref:Protein DEHYDRATION-INDUCED 19-like isoform X1 n=1 Tax=Punica granatum TaxID=22663 RepID=A0A218Y2A5_PUNGR|nr:protein DEHYDRATION-INDUCED 19-like isoform X1 [Punica granatum]OWM91198.1 hypothetical protein CDL15_Pgr000142 [Punica granatum]